MTNPAPIVVIIAAANNEPMLDMQALSLLLGVDVDTLTEHVRQQSPGADRVPFNAGIPHAWLQHGRRRASEARAATGSSELLDCLRYWAGKDLGAEVELRVQP